MRSSQKDTNTVEKKFLFLGTFVVFVLYAWLSHSCLILVGSGQDVAFAVVPTRSVSALRIEDAFRVRIKPGVEERFAFTTDDNLRAYVEAVEEEPGEWTLRLLPGVDYVPKKLEVLVTVKTLAKLTVSEEADVELSGFAELQEPIKIKATDEAKLRWVDRVQISAELNVEIEDNAQVTFSDLLLTSGTEALCRCQGGQLTLRGSGDVFSLSGKLQHTARLMGFLVQTMNVELYDSSSAEVTVQKALAVSLFDRSSLAYGGEPEVQVKVKERDASITQKKAGE